MNTMKFLDEVKIYLKAINSNSDTPLTINDLELYSLKDLKNIVNKNNSLVLK